MKVSVASNGRGGASAAALLAFVPGVRRGNAIPQQQVLDAHPLLKMQREPGCSSWSGFSLTIRLGVQRSRAELLADLRAAGFECRPVVAGNFAKNPVVQYFDHEIFGELRNADHVDRQGLFVGNQHHAMPEAIAALGVLWRK